MSTLQNTPRRPKVRFTDRPSPARAERTPKSLLQEKWSHLFAISPQVPQSSQEVPDYEEIIEIIDDQFFVPEDEPTDNAKFYVPEFDNRCELDEDLVNRNDDEKVNSEQEHVFGRDGAIVYTASIFIANNVSKSLGKDIFKIVSILSKHRSITIRLLTFYSRYQIKLQLPEVWKQIDSWVDHDTNLYCFCANCGSLMSERKICLHKKCNRYMISQANVSSTKMVLTFSIRKQVQDLLDNGAFDKRILQQWQNLPSLSSRTCLTPKYIGRITECETKYPDTVTLLFTLNTDGCRKKGNARGELWPVFLAPNDVTGEHCSFQEYRPEMVVMTSLMLTNISKNFLSLLERMRLEMNSTTENPLIRNLGGKEYKIRLEIYQCCLDMDASRKVHGLPNWMSYGCCSRCDINGVPIKTEKSKKSTIAWYSSIVPTLC